MVIAGGGSQNAPWQRKAGIRGGRGAGDPAQEHAGADTKPVPGGAQDFLACLGQVAGVGADADSWRGNSLWR